MNVLVVDTSVWIDFFKGKTIPDLESALKEARILLPSLVIAELLSGARTKHEETKLTDFLAELNRCNNAFDHWKRVGLLRRDLAKKGLNTSIPDVHIAQCALEVDGYLISPDLIFKKIAKHTSLKLLN